MLLSTMENTEIKQPFTNTLGFKILLVFFIGLLLLIPMTLVRGVIFDRQSYQQEARDSIIDPIGGEFTFYGIMIAIPYYYFESVNTVSGNTTTEELVRVNDHILLMPNDFTVNAHMETEMLSRGIFKTPVFSSDMNIVADFRAFELANEAHPDTISWDEAVLIVGTGDRKNSKNIPSVTVNGEALEIGHANVTETGRTLAYYETAEFSNVSILTNSFVYKLDRETIENGFSSTIAMSIQGGNTVKILPMAGNNIVNLTSNWADVGFSGSWLPTEREFTDNGFSATWEIAGFNTPLYGIRFMEELTDIFYYEMNEESITTTFLLLNDNYSKTERSIKYAMLFIFIPFFALFLCELLTKKKIHAVQYGLIGITNIIFYMLLLSISEHTSFNISYVISAIAVISATGLYVWGITKTIKLGIIIAIVEVVIYAFLFGILQLTDFALLFGTIGLFIAVVVAMYFTRNIQLDSK